MRWHRGHFTAMLVGMTHFITAAALRNPTRSEIPGLLAELDASGQSVAGFARSRDLKPQNLYLAIRKRSSPTPPAFEAVRVVESARAQSAFELHLPGNLRLSVPVDFDGAALQRLLEVLGTC